MALLASDVKINPDLMSSLGGYGTNANNAISGAFGNAKNRLMNDAKARGMNGASVVSPNSYAGDQLGKQQDLATQNLESVLGGGIGNTAYQDQLAQRDFQQQEELAREAADLNRPSLLDQIFQGIGAVGGTGAKIYGATKGNSAPASSYYGNPTLSPALSYIPGGSPTAYYSNPYGSGY